MTDISINNHEDTLLQLLETEDIVAFRNIYTELHPYEQARFFENQKRELRRRIYEYMSPEEMAPIIENLENDEGVQEIMSDMTPTYAADMLAEMYADDAADVLNELDKNQAASYLTIMDDEAAREIKELLHYDEYTAGSIMTTEFISIEAHQTIRSAMQILRREAPDAETIYYLYVINDEKKLVGVISLRDLIISDEDTMIADIMYDRVLSVSVGDDQEIVARTMKDYNFLALPVVDFEGHLLGIITVDDIIDVIDEEASDDYSKLAAVSDMDTADRSSFAAAKKRLPWLIILLFLGMLTASLIGRFEATLDKVAILAVFIPLIAGMAGNTGTQSLAVAVRNIATGNPLENSLWKTLSKEAGTGLITGATCGILVSIVVFLWKGHLILGMLVGVSIFITLFIATIAGALIPLLMHQFKIDPAVASGPFITTINDIISIIVYFGLATAFMQYLL